MVKWSTDNDMKINESKTKEMAICFSRTKNNVDTVPRIYINDTLIERVQENKVLGVTISSDQTWTVHVDKITKKAGKGVYMLYQLKRAGVAQGDLLKVYLSVIRPVLEYACPVWSTCLRKYLSDSMEMVQKRALMCIYPGQPYDELLTNW